MYLDSLIIRRRIVFFLHICLFYWAHIPIYLVHFVFFTCLSLPQCDIVFVFCGYAMHGIHKYTNTHSLSLAHYNICCCFSSLNLLLIWMVILLFNNRLSSTAKQYRVFIVIWPILEGTFHITFTTLLTGLPFQFNFLCQRFCFVFGELKKKEKRQRENL